MMERFFDIFFSGLALLVLSPLLVPIVLILRFSGEGEIFFLQERIGKGGQVFKLFKFATMLKDSPNIGTGTVTMKGDPRVLPVGKFLRKTKINELPQLLNIFFGDMSVIGPRPLTQETFSAYSNEIQDIIIMTKPGLSGVGSIIFRNEEEIINSNNSPVRFYKDVISPYKGKLEKWYVENNNLVMYFSLIFITVLAVLFPKLNILRKVYKTIPEIPDNLDGYIN